ncbi:MAG: carbonic anhydrase [Stellaceae bacterium]
MSPTPCACTAPSSRRHILRLLAGGAGALWLGAAAPRLARAADGTDTLLLSCMDYRLMDKIAAFMDGRGLAANYDHVVLAGASIGVATDAKPDWRHTFWEHLAIARDLHHVSRVMVMDHRDCGAYRLILKKDLTGEAELAAHERMLHRLRHAIAARYPALQTELLFMELDGSTRAIA